MLQQGIIAALNHLTAPESWATERLRQHAGQHASIQAGPFELNLAITSDGLFGEVGSDAEPAVTIQLGNDFPLRFLVDRAAAFNSVRIAGTADFAETLAFVLRNLRWDAEADLSRFVGDIAARRLVMAGQHFVGWQQQAMQNLAANLTEYAQEEAGLITSKNNLGLLRTQLHGLRDDVDRLEKRIRQLER